MRARAHLFLFSELCSILVKASKEFSSDLPFLHFSFVQCLQVSHLKADFPLSGLDVSFKSNLCHSNPSPLWPSGVIKCFGLFFKLDEYNLKCKKADGLHMAAILYFVWLSSWCDWPSDNFLPLRKTNVADIPALRLLFFFPFKLPFLLPLSFVSICCL